MQVNPYLSWEKISLHPALPLVIWVIGNFIQSVTKWQSKSMNPLSDLENV